MLDIRLETRANQGQIITLSQLFPKGPRPIHKENCPEIPVGLGRDTVDRIIKEGSINALVNTHPDRDTRILMLKPCMSQVCQHRAISTRVVRAERKPVH